MAAHFPLAFLFHQSFQATLWCVVKIKFPIPQSTVGQPACWDASGNRDPAGLPLSFRWDLGDGTLSESPHVEHTFDKPGFYRLGLTIDNEHLSDLAWRDVYAVEDLPEVGTEGSGRLVVE